MSLSSLQINVARATAARSESKPAPRAALKRGAGFLYQNIVFVLLPALACILFPSPLLVPGLVLLLVIFFVRWLALASPVPRTQVNPIVLVFLLTVLWSMWRAPNLFDTPLTVARIVGGVALMYVITDYADRPGRLWNVAAGLVGAGVVIAFLAPLVAATSADKLVDVSLLFRLRWNVLEESNPNMVAGALAALLPLALALLLGNEARTSEDPADLLGESHAPRHSGHKQFIGAVALMPMLIMLGLLQARGAWLAALGGVMLYLALFRRWLIALVPLTLLAFVLAYTFSAEILAVAPLPVNALRLSLGLEGRQVVWEYAASEIVRDPLGHGINTFRLYAANRAGDLLTLPQRQHAHNLFLQAGFETGLIGLAAFAAMFGYALYASGHAIVRAVKYDLAIGVFAALVTALASALLEANMWGNKSALVLWGLFGMAVVLGRYSGRRRRQKGRSLNETST